MPSDPDWAEEDPFLHEELGKPGPRRLRDWENALFILALAGAGIGLFVSLVIAVFALARGA